MEGHTFQATERVEMSAFIFNAIVGFYGLEPNVIEAGYPSKVIRRRLRLQ